MSIPEVFMHGGVTVPRTVIIRRRESGKDVGNVDLLTGDVGVL